MCWSLSESIYQDKMSRTDHKEMFRIQKFLLTLTGIWPTRAPTLRYHLMTLQVWIVSIPFCLAMYLEAYAQRSDFVKLSAIVYLLVTCTTYILKVAFLRHLKHGEFLELLDQLEDPAFMSYPMELDHLLKQRVQTMTRISKIALVFQFGIIVLYALIPLLTNELPVPFSYDVGAWKPFLAVFQILGLSNGSYNNLTLDVLTIALIKIAIAHLDILGERLRGMRGVKKELVSCVEHHEAIIK